MQQKINVGIVGIGKWARETHLPYLLAQPFIDKLFAWDPLIEETEIPPGIIRCDTWAELLDTGIQALIISTPNQFHFEQAIMALQKNIHVHVDKPITETVEELSALVACADERNLILSTHTQKKFNPAIGLLKTCLDRHFDHVHHLSGTVWQQAFDDFPNSWRAAQNRRGILMDSGFHVIDTALFLLQTSCRQAEASGISAALNNASHHNDAFSSLHFQLGNTVMQINAFRGVPAQIKKEEFQVFGDGGYIRLTSLATKEKRYQLNLTLANGIVKNEEISVTDNSYKCEPIKLFFESLCGNRRSAQIVKKGIENTFLTIKILEQAYQPAGSNNQLYARPRFVSA